MKQVYENKRFEKQSFTDLTSDEYYDCHFVQCDFSNLLCNSAEFHQCSFESCNISMTAFEHSIFQKVKFSDCKIMGIDFGKCAKYNFSVHFDKCLLKYTLFLKNDLKNTVFAKCSIIECNFLEVNLQKASFADCDLSESIFEQANLEGADFSSARNYCINPEKNRVKKAQFALPEAIGLLQHLGIVIR